jgi:hypothetical protein
MNALTRQEVLAKLDALPSDKVAEIVDFIEFIASRNSASATGSTQSETCRLPDIGDLLGQLSWQDDPVTWQRTMRDEWQ